MCSVSVQVWTKGISISPGRSYSGQQLQSADTAGRHRKDSIMTLEQEEACYKR